MTARHYMRDADGNITEVMVQVGAFEVHDNAEEGSVGSGSVTVEDVNGSLNIVGLRRWMIVEDEVVDPDDQVIWFGYTANRGIKRGPSERTGVSRIWAVNLVDSNSVLSRRIMVGADAKRPAETDVARINWLIGTNEAGIIDDFRYVFDTQPVQMDAADYNGQQVVGIVDDCSQSSGKNYWLDWFADVQQLGIWYGRAGLPDYEAQLAISNVLEDVDGDAIFEMSQDANLDRDPGRVYSGVYLPFDGGNVYKQKAATEAAFAHRDQSMPAANVKTAAKASRRATRYLNDLDTEEDRATLSILVPPTHVNKVRKGMRVNIKASHWPGYETFTPMRVLSKGTTQVSPDFYKVDLELSGGDALPGTGNGAARLYEPFNRDELGDVEPFAYFHSTGDEPGAGRAYSPLSGPLEYVELSGHEGSVWTGIKVLADGVATVKFGASIVGVVTGAISANFQVLLDGGVVASSVVSSTGGLRGEAPGGFTTQTDIAVVADQVFTTQVYFSGTAFGGGKVPAGVGNPAEYLEVTGTFEEI